LTGTRLVEAPFCQPAETLNTQYSLGYQIVNLTLTDTKVQTISRGYDRIV